MAAQTAFRLIYVFSTRPRVLRRLGTGRIFSVVYRLSSDKALCCAQCSERPRVVIRHQETSRLSHLSTATKNTKTLRNRLIALMFLENRTINKFYASQVH
jgi:hypothetical protein